jgi:hypothetical protein
MRPSLTCLVATVVLLSACTAAQLQRAQSSIAAASTDVLATVNAACAEYLPIAETAAKANDATVDAYLTYGNSVCAAGGTSSSGVAADASTAAWVGAITGALRALARPAAAKA